MKSLALTIALLAAAPVQANMVYNWQTIDPLDTGIQLEGRIEITEDAWRTGSMDYQYTPNCPSTECSNSDDRDPASPVVAFYFATDGYQSVPLDLNYREGTGFWAYDYNSFGLTMSYILEGTIIAGAGDAGLYMDSSAGLWTLSGFNADRGDPCMADGDDTTANGCSGVTGMWTLEQVAAVPLPGTLALIGLGLLAVPLRARKPVTPQA